MQWVDAHASRGGPFLAAARQPKASLGRPPHLEPHESADRQSPISVFSALGYGFRFVLVQPLTVLRIAFLPLLTLLACHLAYAWHQVPYLLVVPEQFSPVDWARHAVLIGAMLWAWTSLWGGLFHRYFGEEGGASWGLAAGNMMKLRLMAAFVVLIVVPFLLLAAAPSVLAVVTPALMASNSVEVPLPVNLMTALTQIGQGVQSGFAINAPWAWALALVALGAFGYSLIRLLFLVPYVVHQRRLSVFSAWRRTRGMFWQLSGAFCFAVPVVMMLLAVPMTAGIFVTYYLYPELLTTDIRVSLWLNDAHQVLMLWPTVIGFLVGLSLSSGFWTGVLGSLYQTQSGPRQP